MRIDWERYRTECAKERNNVLSRFGSMLLQGAAVSTVQSAPVCTGALTAALISILKQMTGLLQQSAGSAVPGQKSGPDSAPGSADTDRMDWERIRRQMRRSYFTRLSGIGQLRIAQEYVRTHFLYQEPCEEEMTNWLFSFRGQRGGAAELVRRIDEETDAFILEEVPGILKTQSRDAGRRTGG